MYVYIHFDNEFIFMSHLYREQWAAQCVVPEVFNQSQRGNQVETSDFDTSLIQVC